MSEMIHLESLPVETLAIYANESAELCESCGRLTVEHAIRCGRALLVAKSKVKHGEWLDWLKDHFNYSQPMASRYMDIANYSRANNLAEATSVRDALRLIAESPEKQAKKAEREARKTEAPPRPLAPVTPAPPVSSGVMRNENPPSQPQRPEWLADPDELERPEEDDLPQLPKTNTHHTAQNRRTPDARETDRIGIVPPDDPRSYHDGHWYEWSEDRGRMVAVTDAEILRRADKIRGQSIVEHANTTTPVVEHKRDSVSNKPGKVPTVQQLCNVLRHRQYSDPFWTDAMVTAVERWIEYKQSLTGKAKIRSVQQWEVALTRMENVIAAKGWPAVADMIEKAIANGWQGWEHETSGSRGGSRISTAVRSSRNWDEEIPEWKPTE